MDTFYKCCSLHLDGKLKSSWVCNDPVMALTYEFNKKTEPRVGKLFAGTRYQVVDRTLDTSVQTDFGVILEGEGERAEGPWLKCLCTSLSDVELVRDAWGSWSSDAAAGMREQHYLGVLLHWFTPRHIVAVYTYVGGFLSKEHAIVVLDAVGIYNPERFAPELLQDDLED